MPDKKTTEKKPTTAKQFALRQLGGKRWAEMGNGHLVIKVRMHQITINTSHALC